MAIALTVFLTALLCSSLVSSEQARFPGYKVFRITPTNQNEVEMLRQLEDLGLSFWSGPNPPHRPSDVMVPPHLLDVIDSVRSAGLQVVEFISDVQSVIDETSGKVLTKRSDGQSFEFDKYHRYEPIMSWVKEQAAAHADIASAFSIGNSFEGRELVVLKISKPSPSPKRAIWLDANIHAREWITNAVTLYIIDQLLNGNNTVYQKWTEDYDWYIMPVHNPDGYEFSHESNRMWRKTRSGTGFCRGADPNRNWGYKWLTGGSSTFPCSDTYAGTAEFSESETRLASEFINTIASDLDVFISLHSYSQLILIPYGVRLEFPPHEVHMEIGQRTADAIAARYGKRFTPGNIVDLLYVASGGSTDWIQGVHGVPLSYTFELRDTGAYGFLLPPNQIIPSAIELMDGLEVIIDAVRAGISPANKA